MKFVNEQPTALGNGPLTDEQLAGAESWSAEEFSAGVSDAYRAVVRQHIVQRLVAEVRHRREQLRMLHDQVDQTDPRCPIGAALTRAKSTECP